MTSFGDIVQIEDYFKAITDAGISNTKEQQSYQDNDQLVTSRENTYENQNNEQSYTEQAYYESQSAHNISGIEDQLSILSNTYPSLESIQNQIIEKHQQQKTHKLVLLKPKIEVTLIYTQSAEQNFRIANKNQFKLSLKTRIKDSIKGLSLISPSYIDKFSAQTLHLAIDQIQQIGDIFTSIVIQATSESSFECLQIPLIIRFQRPRLRLQYEGATCYLSYNNNRYPHITLKSSTFKEYSLFITSSHIADIVLDTPMTESSVFPDQLMVGNERRKITIRTKNKQFCLVAKIKSTQLAFVCKISLIQ